MSKTLVLEYMADAGSLRVDTPDAYFLIGNNIGDGVHKVTITTEDLSRQTDGGLSWEFVTVIGIKSTATVSSYDCDDTPIATLTRGRWGVYRRVGGNSGDMLLQLGDQQI